MASEGHPGGGEGADARARVVDHLRRHVQASLTELEEAVGIRGEASGDALIAALDAMEGEGALIRRGHLYALAPWLRDGAEPPT